MTCALPAFEKLGSKLDAPPWLLATGNDLFFPRVFDNDAARSSLPGLPPKRFSVLYSSDHASGAGYIGRADLNYLAGAWTDSCGPIHVASNQRETPHPVFDPISGRVNVYVHDTVSSVPLARQAARLLTTTNLQSLSDHGETLMDAHHSGYGQYVFDAASGLWTAYTGWLGNEVWIAARWTSPTGLNGTWARDQLVHSGAQHVAGDDNLLGGSPFFFTDCDGTFYGIGVLKHRPRLGQKGRKIVAWEADRDTLRPASAMQALVEAGTGSDEDAGGIDGNLWIGLVDGDLHIVYTGVDQGGARHLMLARETVGTSPVTPLQWPVLVDGSLSPEPLNQSMLVDWDAAADDIPTEMQVVEFSGTNVSTHAPGSHYELKTGAGVDQNIWLKTVGLVNPASVERVDFVLGGLTFSAENLVHLSKVQVGFVNSLPDPQHGVVCFWSSMGDIEEFGGIYHYRDGSRLDRGGYVLPYSDTVPISYEFPRSHPVDLTMRVHDFGRRLSVLVDGHVSYHRDISSMVSWTGVFAFLRLVAYPFPEHWARFSRLSVTMGQ